MRAIFLDRDGVICENRSDHVKKWQEFRFLPGAMASLVTLSKLELPIIVVTNQAAINRGLVSANVVEDIHQRMIAEVAAHGGRIDRVIYCPHRPDQDCSCRKPEPGMLLQASEEMKFDLNGSYMVGDAATDLLAGQRVGCRTFLVLTGRGVEQLLPALHSTNGHFTIARSLMGATTQILKTELGTPNETGQHKPYTEHSQKSLPVAGSL